MMSSTRVSKSLLRGAGVACRTVVSVLWFACGSYVCAAGEVADVSCLFVNSLRVYKQARENDVDLTKVGLGGLLAISNAPLFDKYDSVYYLPEPALKLISSSSADVERFLAKKSRSHDRYEARFAGDCLSIIRAKEKVVREGVIKANINGLDYRLCLIHFNKPKRRMNCKAR